MLNRASPVVLGHRLDVEHFEEFELDEVVVRVLILLSQGVRNQRFDCCHGENLPTDCLFAQSVLTVFRAIRLRRQWVPTLVAIILIGRLHR